jgi:hypothetical protein
LKDSSTANTAICIAGAHRSGTSMLTRLLHACGLYLGPENQLMPAQADNPDGFWEHLGFVALNDELLNELGGAWDLPPKADEKFTHPRLDPLRMKAQLLIEGFASPSVWGWKDPRNSLTLPFWQELLPGLKTLVIVRNPLEVAYSMRERNGTSYSFGLRLWENYNRRVIETASAQERFVTHYDFFFENAEMELRRIVQFVGLPDAKVNSAAALVTAQRRHAHFTIDQLIDARASAEVIELYRALTAEADQGASASARKRNKGKIANTPQTAKWGGADLLPGAVSRLNAFVPEWETARRELALRRGAAARPLAKIETLEHEIRQLTLHLARQDGRISEMEVDATRHERERAEYQGQIRQFAGEIEASAARHEKERAGYQTQICQFAAKLQESQSEIEKIREHLVQANQLLHARSISLAQSEARGDDLRNSLRQQLKATRRLLRFLDELDEAAARLRSSRRWQIANPVAALKAVLSPAHGSLGYGHLEKIVSAYQKWRTTHPEVTAIDDQIQDLISGAALAPAQKAAPSATSSAGVYEPPVPTRPIEFPVHEQVDGTRRPEEVWSC